MSAANSKKAAPLHSGFEWAGAMARIRRGGKMMARPGRRAALLGMLSSTYANSGRAGIRAGDSRSGTDRG